VIKRLLVANRGEVAVRVIAACRELGIRSLAVYSEADARSVHVAAADESACIGPPPARESYLSIPAIIRAAQTLNADAIQTPVFAGLSLLAAAGIFYWIFFGGAGRDSWLTIALAAILPECGRLAQEGRGSIKERAGFVPIICRRSAEIVEQQPQRRTRQRAVILPAVALRAFE
jgi:protein tyrosine phosphatase (PTP) superfamily phosphohydrolase (DUF442 family)